MYKRDNMDSDDGSPKGVKEGEMRKKEVSHL